MSKQFKNLLCIIAPVFFFGIVEWSCKKKDVYPSQQLPQIISLSPSSAKAGTDITIKGINLKNVSEVKFGSVTVANFNTGSNTDTAIHVVVPDSLPLGKLYLQVYFTDGKGYASSAFTVLETPPVPKIDSVSPVKAFPGTTLTISGTNFTDVTNVTFAGIAASFAHTLDTNGKITVIVPMNAIGGDQYIKVANANGADSVLFNVDLSPVITAVNPGSGKTGDVITVSGLRFTGITSVTLDSANATFNVLNDSTLTFTVPVGAKNGYVSITNTLGTAVSPQSFVVVVPISKFIFDDNLVANWSISSYTATTVISTTNPESGTNSLQTNYSGGYGAFRLSDYSGLPPIDLTPYTTLRFSIYGGPGTNGNKISVAINGNYSNTVIVYLTEGSYTDYFIPLSSLGSPSTITEIVLQEYSGDATTITYVDNVGLN